MKNRSPAKDYGEELTEKRRGRRLKLLLIGLAVVFVTAAAGAGYLFFYTDLLFSREVKIEGAVSVSRDELISGGPLRLYSRISVNAPRIATFEASRDYLARALTLRVTERKPYAVWCVWGAGEDVATASGTQDVQSDCYWFDSEGFIFVKAPNTEGALLRNVLDASGRSVGVGEHILPEDMRRTLLRVFDMLTNSGVDVLRYRLEFFEKEELTAFTSLGTELYFSLRVSPEFAAEPLKVLLTATSSLKYIDFRSENKVFYKSR